VEIRKHQFIEKMPVWLGFIILGGVSFALTAPRDVTKYPLGWKLAGSAVIAGGMISIVTGGCLALHFLLNDSNQSSR